MGWERRLVFCCAAGALHEAGLGAHDWGCESIAGIIGLDVVCLTVEIAAPVLDAGDVPGSNKLK
jgi:hypothetical protein